MTGFWVAIAVFLLIFGGACFADGGGGELLREIRQYWVRQFYLIFKGGYSE